MKSLVLEEKMRLSLRDFPIEREETMGPRDVRIKIHSVGICGSDVHYYTHGEIGPFKIKAPMILGHEASGTVIKAGDKVTTLKVGERVCMEPGIPDPNSKATRLGMYNIDPAVRFWATPPVHGVLRSSVVHPENFTFKLPDNVSFAEAAMVEPLAVGVHGATKAQIKPGDLALVMGAGTIGLVTALPHLALMGRVCICTHLSCNPPFVSASSSPRAEGRWSRGLSFPKAHTRLPSSPAEAVPALPDHRALLPRVRANP